MESVNRNMKDADYLITNIAPTGGTTKSVRTRVLLAPGKHHFSGHLLG
jgi:hypothetical protein